MNDNSAFRKLNLGKTYQQALSALVDNELSPRERAVLLEHVANDPQATERIERYKAQNAALKALFPISQENAHGAFLPRRASWLKRAGVAGTWLACGLLIGLVPGWLGSNFFIGQPAFARSADIAYAVYAPEQRHPVEVAAADETHLINWLSKRLDRPLTAPSLQQYGYSLMGGRLLPGDSGPAAQFMYQDNSGKRLTLYITVASKPASAIRMLQDKSGQGTFYWVNEGMGYALSGSITKTNLHSIATDVSNVLGGGSKVWQ